MRIYSMTATFGKLEHETLTLQPGLNIIQANNEWGKSTWCAFLLAMLYGIETKAHSTKTALADKTRYAPWSGSPMSGSIILNWNGRDITIERRSKGRSLLGEFQAFETQTGLPVQELTASNCGEQLLGVEREVFARAGFLRLTDLPVTQDESLRRRLNALVTTGDESGAADMLAQKLKEIKNRCRFNKTGLLPQAEAQRDSLQQKIQEIGQIQQQMQRLQERKKTLQAYTEDLENHRQTLEYQSVQAYEQKMAAAQLQLDTLDAQVKTLQRSCADLPETQVLLKNRTRLQELREQRDALQMDGQMLPPPPEKPEGHPAFRGYTGQEAVEKAQRDSDRLTQLKNTRKKSSPLLWILGILVLLAGAGLLLRNTQAALLVLGAGVLLTAGGLLYQMSIKNRNAHIQRQMELLLQHYHAMEPEQWVKAAQTYAVNQTSYEAVMKGYHANLTQIEQKMAAVRKAIADLTGGLTLAQYEQFLASAIDQHRQLEDALREQHRLTDMVQMLQSSHKSIARPDRPDTLTYPLPETMRLLSDAAVEQHQLQHKLGLYQGQMEALGDPALLQNSLEQVQQRIEKLEGLLSAVTLAQQTLADATTELQRRFAPRISKRAQTLFEKLTGGRYDRLTLTEDLSVNAGAQGEDTVRTSLWRSDGTIDQLYFALRLAVAEELTPEAPLVLDDVLVRFDDIRLASAMGILREEAQTKQVILFTCQSREAAMQDHI